MDVTKKNFEELFPEIKKKIKTASFICIDAEYTGLYAEEIKGSNSLFDTAPKRYSRLKKNLSTFGVCQIGLAFYEKSRDGEIHSSCASAYLVHAYNFYVFPVAFDSFGKREILATQVSCLNFLARNHFDFNKFINEGVPFLNREKRQNLFTFLNSNRHFMNTCEYLDKDYFPKQIEYLKDTDIREIVDRLEGFSKVIKAIGKSKKPVIGHNMLMDLMFIHQLFHKDLPDSYETFKKNVHELFPKIYDTKCVAWGVHLLRQSIDPEDRILSDTNLFSLYSNLSAVLLPVLKPFIEPMEETAVYKEALLLGQTKNLETVSIASCHNAGFDAVVTGAVYLKLGYIACRPNVIAEHLQGLHPTVTEIFKRVSIWKDEVNLARAMIRNISLSGEDPVSERPDWIRIKSSQKHKFVDPVAIRQKLSKFGDVEIEVISQQEAIVACGGFGCFRNAWKILSNDGYILSRERSGEFSQQLWKWGLKIGSFTLLLGGTYWMLRKK